MDPDRRTTLRLAALLQEDGFDVETLPDGASPLSRASALPEIDAIVTELNLPLVHAAEVVRLALMRSPRLRVVVLTRHPNLVEPSDFAATLHILTKPLDYGRLLEVLAESSTAEARPARLFASRGAY